MWSFFSSDPAKAFAYEIGEKVSGLEEKSIWSLHHGKHKANGTPVSVFVFDIKASSESQVQLAKASFKKIKTLRHPNILTYLDGLENEKVLYVVTEEVVPLEVYLEQNKDNTTQNEMAISWGLFQTVKGLSFLVNDCNFIHNNICMSSIFVSTSGEWKLGGVDYMYPATGPEAIPPVKILPALERYDPPEKARGGGRKGGEKWSVDSWGLGCLIWEVFNGSLPRTTALKTLGKIPKSLVPKYGELVGANPRARPNPAQLIEDCRARGGFMDNKFVETMLFLEEMQIKDQAEKTAFFNSLPPALDSFPHQFCKLRILPQLLHAFEYGNAGSAVLTPLFKVGKLLEPGEYQTKIVPCIVKLFSSTDRATRVKLLQQMGEFVEFLSPDVVNNQVFPSVVQGFMDTNPVVREHTIKSMLHLAPKLNYKNLNEEILKHFARLQSKDDQGGIRTNTTVCLGKIACHLNPQIRQKCLSSAYLRSLKDPFPPSRQAGILAMAATHNFFTLQESALRLLPSLCQLTLDPDKGVRDQAFKAIKCFLTKLEKVSDDPECLAEMEKDVTTGGSTSSLASGWTGWAASGIGSIGSITSKIYKGRAGAPQAGNTVQSHIGNLPKSPRSSASPPPAPSQPTTATPTSAPPPGDAVTSSRIPPPSSQDDLDIEEDEGGEGWDDGGWGNDDDAEWGDMDDVSGGGPAVGGALSAATDGWDADDADADWGALDGGNKTASLDSVLVKKESTPWGAADFTPSQPGETSTAAYNWGEPNPDSDDFFSNLISDKASSKKKPTTQILKSSGKTSQVSSSKPRSTPTRDSPSPRDAATPPRTTPAPAKKAPAPAKQEADFGWGDDSGWGDADDWGSMGADTGLSRAEQAKREREEKRLQRQRELEQKRAAKAAAGGGALKLGTKKLAKD